MRTDYIKSFLEVVHCKSFSLAAKNLYLSQSTLSTHIKQLEDELCAQLFIRSTKEIILTEKGKAFYPFALQFYETEKEALSHLQQTDNSIKEISIAASSTPCHSILPQFLTYCFNHYPSIRFRITETTADEIFLKLMNFEIDFGITTQESQNKNLHSEVLFEDEIILATPNLPKYRDLNGVFPYEQLKNEKFVPCKISDEAEIIMDSMKRELNINPDKLQIAVQFNSPEMVRKAIESGLGVSFSKRSLVSKSIEAGSILAFSFNDLKTTCKTYLVYNKKNILSSESKKFLNNIKNYFKDFF